MKFFIDTADLSEIEELNAYGIVDGVTTNPSLVAKAGIDTADASAVKEHITKIAQTVDGPISMEAVSTDTEGIVTEAREFRSWADNIVVKVPMIPDGVKALKICHEEGIPTNCTLIFSAAQGLLAMKAGASYISPFIGRLDDQGADGMELISQLRAITDNYDFPGGPQILAASIRTVLHVVQAATIGAHVATIPAKVLQQMFEHTLTDKGLAAFLADWQGK